MLKKSYIINLVLIFSLVFALGVNVQAASYEYKTKEEGEITIGFSQVVMNHPFRRAMVSTLEAEAEKFDDVSVIITNAEGDVSNEISNIQSMIARGVDAIIVSSLSGRSIYPAYREVANAGIPLIIAASGVPEDPDVPYVTFVSTDEVAMGQRAADYVVNKMKGKGNLVVIDGVPESTNSVLRRQGFMPQIEKYWPEINIVAHQTGQWLRQPTMRLMANILQANDQIDAVYAQNDEMALGAISAIEDAGREDEMFVVAMDGQKEALEAIMDPDNIFDMTIKNEWSMEQALKTTIAVVRGENVDKKVVMDTPMINMYNVEYHYSEDSAM
jgi:ribose transport system substrate-binding protein